MKKNRSDIPVIILIVILLFVALLSAVAVFTGSDDERTYRVSVIYTDNTDTQWQNLTAGFNEAAAHTSISIKVVSAGQINSLSRQQEIIRQEISSGAQGIIFEPVTSEGLTELLEEFSSQVKLIVVGSGFDNPEGYENVMFLDADDERVGMSVGSELVIYLQENKVSKGKVGVITANRSLSSTKQKLEGFRNTAEKNDLEIAWTVGGGTMISANQASSFARILIGLDDASLKEATAYAEDKNGITIIGYGSSSQNLYALDAGLITAMIVPDYYTAGYEIVNRMASSFTDNALFRGVYTINVSVINRDNMFLEENQRKLFPITD